MLPVFKVEKILKGSLDLISSPSSIVKIQIMGRKVCFRCNGKTLLGIVNKILKTKSLLTSTSNVLTYFLPMILIFTESEGVNQIQAIFLNLFRSSLSSVRCI